MDITPAMTQEPTHNDPIADAKAQEATQKFTFRIATTADVPALQSVIEVSLRALASGHYTQAELDGSIGWLFGADTVLLRVRLFRFFVFVSIFFPNLNNCPSGLFLYAPISP
jgi:hypothetical protein